MRVRAHDTPLIGCSGSADVLESCHLMPYAKHAATCCSMGWSARAGTIELWGGWEAGRARHVQRRTPVLLCMVCSRNGMSGLQAGELCNGLAIAAS